jgi:ribokinase
MGAGLMPEIVALGDVNVDIIARFDRYPAQGEDALASAIELHCGGSAANTAMALARLGVETSLISRVGPDSWALKALRCLNEAGVDPQGLQRDPAVMTGMMYVVVTPDGERTMLGHRGANVYTDPNQIREKDISQATGFHLSGYALLSEPQRSAALLALEIACRHGLTVTLDPGMSVPQAVLDEMHALLPVINLFLPSLAEAQALTGLTTPSECAQALLDKGVEVVALKLGIRGCLLANDEGLTSIPGFSVETQDSTGAGDSFAAGMITGFLRGLDWPSAAVLGNAMGAMAAAQMGAGTVAPQARQVLTLLRDRRCWSTQAECVQAVKQAIDHVRSMVTEPQEEGQPWWG